MNKLISFKSIYYIFFLYFGIRSISCLLNDPQKTVVEDVDVLEVGLAKTVHCINYYRKTVLQCKPKHVLVVHAAQWSNASCEQKSNPDAETAKTHLYFNRTETLQQLCDGLSYCFLKPSRNRDEHSTTFLGDPLVYHKLPNTNTTNNYSLTVSVSCLNRELNVKGRKVTDTFESKENNVDFGCNEDELIHLSVTRVDGYSEDGPNRLLKQYNFGPHVFDCHLKQKCRITPEQLKKSESKGDFVFGTGVLVYYCRKPMKFAFCDHVVVTEDQRSTPYDKFVLYAEQDSQVTVKSPMFTVLQVHSATWSTPEKLTDANVKKDRTELVKFLCENRNYCAFTPKRSAAGVVDTSYEEVHFGGIVSDNKSLVLLATFTTRHVKDLQTLNLTGLKSVTTPLTQELRLQCDSGEEGTLHVLSAVAGPTSKTNPTTVENSDMNSVKFKDLTRVLHKICYRKTTCQWNLNPIPPAEPTAGPGPATGQRSGSSAGSGSGAAGAAASAFQAYSTVQSLLELSSETGTAKSPAPPAAKTPPERKNKVHRVPAGLENQEITVKYFCKKYTHDPSLVDSRTSSQFLEMSDTLGSYTSTVDKEQAKMVSLVKKSRLFINLEVFGASTVTVGGFFTVTVPNLGTGNAEAFFDDNPGGKFTKALTGNFNKYVLYLSFFDEHTVDFALDASDGVNETHHTGRLTTTKTLLYPVHLKDVVKATGGIVGMRVYLAPK